MLGTAMLERYHFKALRVIISFSGVHSIPGNAGFKIFGVLVF